MNTQILSTGAALPARKVTNSDLAGLVKNYHPIKGKGSLDGWIRRKYGISSRYWVVDESAADLAAAAAIQALARAGIAAKELDFLILHTASGDYRQPTTATRVQGQIGMRPDSFALELNLPCAGSIFALTVADGYLKSGKFRYGLVIGVEVMTRIMDQSDFVMAGLFADGAGAVVLGRGKNGGMGEFVLGSMAETGPVEDFALGMPEGILHMNHSKVRTLILDKVSDSLQQLCRRSGVSPQDIDWVIPHQASQNFMLEACKIAEIAPEKVLFSLEEFGNTSSASILLTLDRHRDRALRSGNHIFLAGVGGGLNWGAIHYICP